MIAFGARDFAPVETSAYRYLNALNACLGNFCDLLLNRSSVRNAFFELRCNRLGYELCVLIDFFDLFDVDNYGFAFRKFGKVFFYSRAFL